MLRGVGGKATEGSCQLWAGRAGSRELLSWLRSVARRGPGGLLRSGESLVLAALVGIALSTRKCLSRGKGTGQLAFCPFSHSRGHRVSSRTGPSRERAGPGTAPSGFSASLMTGEGIGAVVPLALPAACQPGLTLTPWPLPSQLRREALRPGSLGSGSGTPGGQLEWGAAVQSRLRAHPGKSPRWSVR